MTEEGGFTVPRSRIAIVVLALTICQAALATQAFGAEDVPFKGSDEGGFQLPGACAGGSLEEVVIGGTGRATQLGAYTYSATECFDAVSGAFAGSATLTAANGDAMTGTYQGQVSGTDDPNVIAYEEELELTGGTGRFAGATGTLQVAGVANLLTLEYGQTLTGTVSRPNAT
jgi:hypothetical protein